MTFHNLDLDYLKQIAERRNKRIEQERIDAEKKAKIQPEQKIVVPSSDLENPQDYILLEGRKHETYEYPDTLVSIERNFMNKNWNQCHEMLGKERAYMLTIRQFVDFLNLLKSGKAYDGTGEKLEPKFLEELFLDTVEVREPYRAEWLDAKFGRETITYHLIQPDGTLKEITEPLENALTANHNIDLESWLKTADYHGLPTSKTKDGKLCYWSPIKGYVARFGANSDRADFNCNGFPTYTFSALGVSIARRSQAPKPSQDFGGSK